MGDGRRQVEAGVPAQVDHGVAFHHMFVECRQAGDQLDGGAGREAGLQPQLLIHHGQNAPGVRIGHHHAAPRGSQAATAARRTVEIFAVDVIALGGIYRRRPPDGRESWARPFFLAAAEATLGLARRQTGVPIDQAGGHKWRKEAFHL